MYATSFIDVKGIILIYLLLYSIFVDNTVLSITGFIVIMRVDIILIYCQNENVMSHSDL